METHIVEQAGPADQHTFLMRMWREENGEWRVMLQHTQTREHYGFRDLVGAFNFVDSFCQAGKS